MPSSHAGSGRGARDVSAMLVEDAVDVTLLERLGQTLARFGQRKMQRKDLLETVINRFPFVVREHAAANERSRVCAAGADIDFEENSVNPERPVQLFENRIALLLKPALP